MGDFRCFVVFGVLVFFQGLRYGIEEFFRQGPCSYRTDIWARVLRCSEMGASSGTQHNFIVAPGMRQRIEILWYEATLGGHSAT